MNNTYAVKPGKSYTLDASAFRIVRADLYNNVDEEPLDITNFMVEISIEESLFKPYVSLSILILDAISMIETYKLNGGERLVLELDREVPPDADGLFDGNNRHFWNMDFRVTEILGQVKQGPSKQFFTIKANNSEIFHNSSSLLDRAFTDTPAKLVESIIKSDLKSKKYDVDVDSKGIVSGIFPRVRAISAIHWLTESSFDNGTPFFFYATAKDGLRYTSYDKLLDKDSYGKYNFKPFFKELNSDDTAYDEQLYRIQGMSSPLNIGKVANVMMGAYSGSAHVVDPSTKSYNKPEFNYSSMRRMNEFDPYNQPNDLETLNELTNSRSLFISKNDLSYEKSDNLYGPSGGAMLKSNAYKNNLNFMTHTITVPGNFNLSAGTILDVQVRRVGEGLETGEDRDANPELKSRMMRDEFLSGKYMVTGIRSTFTSQGFNMFVTIQTDSSSVDLTAAVGNKTS